LEESKSKIELRIIVHGKGEASAEVFRHLSPRTIQTLLLKLPIHARITRMGNNRICVINKISVGVEKGKRDFIKGDLALFPLDGYIYAFLKEVKLAQSMNQIGKVVSGLNIFENIKRGDTVTLDIKQK